jgi:hypothetical protein
VEILAFDHASILAVVVAAAASTPPTCFRFTGGGGGHKVNHTVLIHPHTQRTHHPHVLWT